MGDEGVPLASDPKLKRLFRTYNKRYFGGKLPSRRTRVIFADGRNAELTPCEAGRCVVYDDGSALILIHNALRTDRQWPLIKQTLLHEMTHLSGIPNHGPEFEREMCRLARLGAFAQRGNQPSLW